MHACPDEAELAAFLDRTLLPGERATIESHVDSCRSCRETIALVAGSDQPRKLGRYRLERVLGRGGMGVVWHAWDPALERPVAIKLLHPDIVEHAGARLMREARTLAKLQHPNVIAVHDVGDVEGELFIATELVDGETLDRWQQGRSPAEILDAYAQAARGLAAVHALGLVHRDVKPSNILVSRDGRVRVGDFGLAIANEVDDSGSGVRRSDPKLTSDGAIVGTPAYMAPEQRLDSSVDARADQYSLCLALAEALLGERPSDPSKLTPSGVLAPWQAIARGLAAKPEDRYPDLAPLIAALAGQRRRSRWWFAAAGAVAIAAVTTVIVLARRTDPAAACAELPRLAWDRAAIRNAFAATHLPYAADSANVTVAALESWSNELAKEERRACEDAATGRQSAELAGKRRACLGRARDELRALVADLAKPDATAIQRAPSSARLLTSPAACNTEAGLADQIIAPGAVATALQDRVMDARALRRLGRLTEARAAAEAVLADARTNNNLPAIAEAQLALGTIQHTQGDRKAAEQTLEDALGVAAQAHADQTAASISAMLVEVVGQDGDVDAAERQARLARAAITRAGKDRLLEAVVERGLGRAYQVASKYAAALEHYQKAEAIHAAVGASDDVDFDLRAEVVQLASLDRLDEATRINERVLDSDRKHLGPLHPGTIKDVTSGALILARAGRYAESAAALEQNIRIDEQVAGEGSRDVAQMRARLAAMYMMLGRLEEAEATLRSALRVLAPGADSKEARDQRMNLAAIQLLLGHYADAEAELAAVIAAARADKDREALGQFLQNYGEALTRDGKHREALAAAQEAIAVDATVFGAMSRLGAQAHGTLGNVYVGLGKPDAAVAEYRTAIAWFEKIVGPDTTELGEPLTRLAEIELARGHAAAARPLLERAARLLEHGDPVDLARCRFALARALPDVTAAVVEARAALELYAQAGARAAAQHAEVARWLAAHR